KVEVTYRENDVTPKPMTPGQLELFGSDVAQLVINPEDVPAFAPPVRLTDNPDVDYAIITPNSQSTWFLNLIDWRVKKGYNTQVFTTEWIATNYPSGRDTQEKIRLFIIDYYTNHGLKYVLLAGDNAQVPGRRCRAVVSGSTGDIPADVYYADLQWSYDGNRNNIFGEIDGDTVDLYYDVYVGRASVDNQTQANTFVNKTLFYEKTPTTDYLRRVLLPYVMLFSSSNYSGKVVSDSIAAQTPTGWTDRYIANPTSTTPMRDSINNGFHLCHVAAHGNATGFYTESGIAIWNTSVAGGQTNSTRPTILNSIACISGDFETSDCLAEAAMNNANGGTVACMMNSREGWGTPPSMGPSEKMDNKFYTYFFGYDTMDIGVLHARSKDFYASAAQSQSVWRWCYWDLNLFGDPNLTLWKDTPTSMDAAHASTIQTGAQSFTVTVTSGGSPVQKALVACYKSGEVQVRGWTNSSGQVSLIINPPTTGTMYVTVTHPTHLPVEHQVTVTQGAPQPYITFIRAVVDDGNNNRLDPGETANLWVTIKNIGNAQATTVQGTLRNTSAYITLNDSTSNYGTLNANDTSRGDVYNLTASSSTPPGTKVSFTLHVTSGQGSWDPTFELTVGAPAQPGAIVMDHDTGYCKLSVTCLGSVGYDEPPGDLDLGSGFCYPKSGGSQLYYGSLAIGNSTSYVVDRYFGQPASSGPNRDFAIVDSLRNVLPPDGGDEHFRCAISDAAHSAPKGLRINQHSFQCANPGYDDFVVLTYDIANNGTSQIDGLYAGIFADFDIGSAPTANICSSDVSRRLTFMRQSSNANPSVGVKILDPKSYANLAAVDHARYVYPDSCMSDGQKWRFLNATITQPNSNRAYDWSLCVSAGPFNLPVGASYRFAVAFVGGTSGANIRANADSAQAWYDRNTGIFEQPSPGLRDALGLTCVPNPFTRTVNIRMQLPSAGHIKLQVFDISGREIANLMDQERGAGKIEAIWNPKGLANGVYLVKASLPDGSVTEKLMLLR
ncbi:MAG: C25 family cysteine peptidase, partial [candidate division WOR-3 bacterium]